MNESSFLSHVALRLKAGEPVVWIESVDDDWIVEGVKRIVGAWGDCRVVEKIDFEAVDMGESKRRVVWVWQGAMQADISVAEKALLMRSKRLRAPSTVVVLVSPTSVVRPATLENIPILSAPLPSLEARQALIKLALGAHVKDASLIDQMGFATAGMSRLQIYRVLMRILIESRENAEFNSWIPRITEEKKQLLAANLSLDVVDDVTKMSEVGGADELKMWLSERSQAFGVRAREFGLTPPRGVLLVGIQGCGKSLIAKSIANAWGFPLLRLDITAIFSASDAPDAVLRHALRVADAMSPAIIWCDEIEKAFADNADTTTRRLLGHILNWMQERQSSAFFVATANDVRHLPAELMRKGRFDELFFLDLPDLDSRAQIFGIHLKKRGRNPDDFDLHRLAMESVNFSGAEIEQAVVAALFTAFNRQKDVSTEGILDELHDIVPLYKQREDDVKELREWASEKTRHAANNARMLSYFVH